MPERTNKERAEEGKTSWEKENDKNGKKESGNVIKTEGKKCVKDRMFCIRIFSLKLEQE